MNSYKKLIPAILGITLCLALVIYFGQIHLDPRGSYTISDGELEGRFNGFSFSIGFYTKEIYSPDVSELVTCKGEQLDYPSRRTETLVSLFGSIEGIVAKDGGDEYWISDAADLEEYIRIMQEQETPENTPSGVIPEACTYTESYAKDGVEFCVDHRVSEIVWRLPKAITKRDEQVELVRQFAAALGVETFFDFANPISTDRGIIVPTRVEGLPLVAATRDFLLDRDQELWLLKYQGYASEHMGLSLQAFGDGTSIQSINTILPVASSSNKQSVISLEEALDALKSAFDAVFVDDAYSAQHPYEIRDIYLGYGAIYAGAGEYSLEPLWVFVDEQDLAWDYCFLVHAHTGEVYQKISAEHFEELNQAK